MKKESSVRKASVVGCWRCSREEAGRGGAQHLKMLVNFRQGIIFTLGYFGYPKDASPFVQARLPTGWSHKKRCSKALSFQSDNAPAGSKFTLRPKALAEQAAKAWCWGWWNDVECFV